jgi:outer membrane protein
MKTAKLALSASLLLAHTGLALAQNAAPLTLAQAEQTALQKHPQIDTAQYVSLAAEQAVREVRSAYFPTATASLTGAQAQTGSRIAAGGLNNPIIYDRFATGLAVGQLITDFGRTRALVDSSSSAARAQDENVSSQRATVILDVDRAYFDVLRAQAVERVARFTVESRQLVVDQVSALAASNLKSGLDVSFARVNLSSAQLLLAQAENDTQRAYATLTATLGSNVRTDYGLVEEPLSAPPPDDSAALVAEALQRRPELLAGRLNAEASARFADAERDLFLPSVSAVAAVGVTPYHQFGITDQYSAIGININFPVMNGSLFAARRAEATLRVEAANGRVRDLENQIARDVRIAWLNARTSFQRLDLTNELLAQASQALELAQSRYDLGLSSIVELSQAQLNKTQAELEQASAKYEYQVQAAALAFATGQRQ